MIKSIAMALVASASLCLAGCAGAEAQLQSFNDNAQVALSAAQQTVANDVALKLIDATTGQKIAADINIALALIQAGDDAIAAHDATTALAKKQAVAAALVEVNSAILAAVQAGLKP